MPLGSDPRTKGLARVGRALLKAEQLRILKLTDAQIRFAREAIARDYDPPRPAKALLKDLGDPECPLDTPPSPDLVRQCRRALGWSQGMMAWKLGSASSGMKGTTISRTEGGKRTLKRAERLLLFVHIEKLVEREAREKKIGWG